MKSGARSRGRAFGLFAVALLVMGAGPGGAMAQLASLDLPRVEVRGGLARNGSGGCGGGGSSGFTLGAEARTRGRFILGGTADIFVTPGVACLDVERFGTFDGATAAIEDLHRVGPRLGVELGYGFSMLGAPADLTAGLGIAGTWYSAREGDTFAWRAWQGATLTVRMRSGIGLQAELGRHRLLDRYYVPDNQTGGGMFLGEQARWEPM
ncbi:MAG: hypothetical protein PVH96_10545, partial [Gemmatimonadota bacterium]